MAGCDELACVYASLILADDDVEVTVDKICAILKAANVDVEPFWPGMFAKALESMSIKELITSVGSAVGSTAPAAGGAASGGDAPKEEEKKKEAEPESDESDDDMGFGLFE